MAVLHSLGGGEGRVDAILPVSVVGYACKELLTYMAG